MEYQDDGGFFGGFSLSNLRGAALMSALIVLAAVGTLGVMYFFFRDVAQF